MITSLIPSFNAGELSPLIHLRSDLEKYRSGCRTLENMLITPYGGVRRRPGLEFVAQARGRARLLLFQYAIDDAYILEFSAGGMRVFRAGEQVQAPAPGAWVTATVYPKGAFVTSSSVTYYCQEAHTSGTFATDLAAGKWVAQTAYEIPTPYTLDELFEFQMSQVNNIAYLVHPNHPPHKLTRLATDQWLLEPVDWTFPPLLDENVDEDWTLETDFDDGGSGPFPAWASGTNYVVGTRRTNGGTDYVCISNHTSSASTEPGVGGSWRVRWRINFSDKSAVIGQQMTIESSRLLFLPGHIGSVFQISKERSIGDYETFLKAISANDGVRSDILVIQGRWSVNTYGTWYGTFFLERSKDRGETWEDIRSWESDGDRNVSVEGEEPNRVLLRLRWAHSANGSSDPRAVLGSVDGFIRGLVRITGVTDALNATAVAVTPVEKCVTEFWAEGAWSDARGFPRAVTTHEQRVIYGGTEYRSQSLWGSVIDDYENFQRGVEDDDSWVHSLASDQQNDIQWLLSQKQLLVGTTGSEWVMASSKEDVPITPTNIRARRHSGHGSEYLQATLVNDVALFVQRGSRKIREMAFSFESDGYVTQDLTMLAEHITEGGIIQSAY